jgi:hypothetical protein
LRHHAAQFGVLIEAIALRIVWAPDALLRNILEALPVIATAVMQAKGMPPSDAAFKEIVAARALTVLQRLAKRGAVVKHGTSRAAQRALMPTRGLDKLTVDNCFW